VPDSLDGRQEGRKLRGSSGRPDLLERVTERGGSARVGGFPANESVKDGEENKREGGRDARDGRRDLLGLGATGLWQDTWGSGLSSHRMLGFRLDAWFPDSPTTAGCVVSGRCVVSDPLLCFFFFFARLLF
jgi:hypothetical protein